MLGMKIKHPKSTNYDDDLDKPPVKRIKLSPAEEDENGWIIPPEKRPRYQDREIPDSDADSDAEDLKVATSARKTDLETALPQIKTDKEAIAEYEATRAAQEAQEGGLEGRLSQRKWIRGKSSIYVDAFNLALETVLEDESHLFNEAEMSLFTHWRELSYEAQYL